LFSGQAGLINQLNMLYGATRTLGQRFIDVYGYNQDKRYINYSFINHILCIPLQGYWKSSSYSGSSLDS